MSDQGTEQQWQRDASGGSGVYLVKRGSPVRYGPFALQSAAENLRKDLNALEAELRDTRQRLETAEAKAGRYHVSLERIKTYGAVCEEFELCHHDACRDSYSAWAEADAALSRDTSSEEVKG